MKKILLAERSLLALCFALGVMQASVNRYKMLSDGVSYLDIGDAYFRGDWTAATNAYWSPMYSWCLGLALYLLKPSIWWEFIIVHLVNLVIYVLALFSFRFFIHSVLRTLRRGSATKPDDLIPMPECALLWIGYSLFLWASLILIDVGTVTPDLLLAAVVFLIGGYLLDLRVGHSYRSFAIFGALNGAAYLSKSIMFPLGFGFLAILLFSGKLSKARIYGVLLSTAVFFLVASPLIFTLTRAKGRLTFGDAGKLTYVAMVSPRAPQRDWQGEPAGSGIPRHPTRKLLDDPPVFEFGEPISGTYPAWDDPSYWNEGVQWRFNLRSQLRVLIESAFAYQKVLLGELGLLAGVLVFLFMGGKPTLRAIASSWPLWATASLSIAAYSLVLVETRYLGASMVLLCVAIFAGVRLPEAGGLYNVSKYIASAVAVTILVSVMAHITNAAYEINTVGANPSSKDQVATAVGLETMGLRAGDKVAVVGSGLTNHWARLGRFRIVAESSYAGSTYTAPFWASSPERRDLAYECFRHTGAKVVVAWDPPSNGIDARWKQISGTRYYAYFLEEYKPREKSSFQ